MTYQDEETSDFTLFEIRYTATNKQANEIWSWVAGTDQARRYHQLDMVLKMAHLDVSNEDVRRYVEDISAEHGALLDKLSAIVRLRLREMGVVA